MPKFNDIRKNLNDALSKQENAKHELFLKEKQLKSIQAKIREFDLSNKSEHPQDIESKYQFEKHAAHLIERIEAEKKMIDKLRDVVVELSSQYDFYSDPIKNIANLDDRNPIMLLPIRIETRFKKVKSEGDSETNQLWVRVYPDDIAIDSFEENLSKHEVESAENYWHGIWQAGGRETMERSAWRRLVSNYGSGRARYIIEKWNSREQWKKYTDQFLPKEATENDFILSIGVNELPPLEEQSIIKEFWKDLWLAGTNTEKQKETHTALLSNLTGTLDQNKNRVKEITETLRPSNFDDFSQQSNENIKVSVHFILFPKAENMITKDDSWSQAAKTRVMPDRFVVTAYNGSTYNNENIAFQKIGKPISPVLTMSPDPSLSVEEQLRQENGELIVNKDLLWMFDFEEAVTKGMGFKINITDDQMQHGFDRIVVLGVKISSDEAKSVETIEQLFRNHERSEKGLSILPQGTPTNNTEADDSGYLYVEDADVSFDQLKKGSQFREEDDWLAKKDGQWLSEWLGVDMKVFQNTNNASLSDQSEARAMNIALFPATLGYMMESLMSEVFTLRDDLNNKESKKVPGDVEDTRFFFNNFVSARGAIPSIKVGRQPYGIMPTTKFSNMEWLNQNVFSWSEKIPWSEEIKHFIPKLYNILKKIDTDWQKMLKDVSFVGKKTTDAHQMLLDIIGLTPNSIEFYQRYAESDSSVFNRFKLIDSEIKWSKEYEKKGLELLKQFGYHGKITPKILKKIFLKSQNKLRNHLIDDVPLSETLEIRKYATSSTNKQINYIEWLIEAAEISHNTLRLQKGFLDDKVPSALLYLMLKHSLDLGYIHTSLFLNLQTGLINLSEYQNLKIDPDVLHIETGKKQTESPWKHLYETNERATKNNSMLMGEYIPHLIKTESASYYLKEQFVALDYLKNVPTARLERVFTEHIDLCTYRLDAWKNALMSYQLLVMRFGNSVPNGGNAPVSEYPFGYERKTATYLGAYGWVEDIRPKKELLTPTTLDGDLYKDFIENHTSPLLNDPANGGFIGAPSLDHAVTAAILRSAYMSDENPDVFEINLSSERVRKALAIIEGIREGQNLSALLGYYFERELRDQNKELDDIHYYLHLLRKAFPLRLNKLKATKYDDSDAHESIQANEVIDGLALINHIKKTGKSNYPFGKSILPNLSDETPYNAIKAAINEQVNNITNLNDAIADVAIAESVHQAVLGNYDRAAATLETYSKGNFPPIPDVVKTPRKGINITQRFGLQFEAGITPDPLSNPRTKAEPAMAKWLKDVLPDMSKIATKVVIKNHDGTETEIEISLTKLKLEALDLLFLINTDDEKSMTALDDIIENYIFNNYEHPPRPDSDIKILYTKRIADKINLFQLAAQMSSLRKLLLQSRPLEPMDISLPSEAITSENDTMFLNENRVSTAITHLKIIVTEINAYIDSFSHWLKDIDTNREPLLERFDMYTSNLTKILSKLELYGLPQTGTGYIFEKRREVYKELISKIEELTGRWDDQLTDFEKVIDLYDNSPADATEEYKFSLLYQAESNITTKITSPQPASLNDFLILLNSKKSALVSKQDDFKAILTANHNEVIKLLEAINLNVAIDDFDFTDFSVSEQEDSMLYFTEELENHARALKTDIEKRLVAANALKDEAINLPDSKKRVTLVQDAGKKLFGEDFKMIPEFILLEEQANDWSSSYQDRDKLLSYLRETKKRHFPLDEWVYSLARVREKVQEWEKLLSITEAFGKKSLELIPIQLPYQIDDTWLASDYPESYEITTDKMLYTAHYASTFNKNGPQSGLLLDEWTEVIPSATEDVGVSFHYDRPNSEPPQVILLAMPSQFKGEWSWDNLMEVVNDTLDQAKKRAIEPEQIDKTDYARFLPATVSSVIRHPIMPSLNYSFLNLVYNYFTPQNDE